MKRFRSNLSSKVLIPLGKTFSGRRFFLAKKYQRYLYKSQYQDRSILRAKRIASLKKLIAHCYHNVPYYHQLMEKIGINPEDISGLEDLKNFPLLTKSTLRENFNSLRANNIPISKMKLEASGGTTGTPIQLFIDSTTQYRVDASDWRFWSWANFLPGMKVAEFWGHINELKKSKTIYSKLKLLMENTFMLNAFDLSEENMNMYLKLINQKKPDIFHGYASAILRFTRYIRDQGKKIHKPKSIILTADKIHQKEKIEIGSFYNCGVYDEYGCREFSIIAHECEYHTGLHVADEHFIIEVIDPENGHENTNEFGEIIITSLVNYSMPLIRYQIGDLGRILDDKCQCGRTLTLIDFISGRTADFVITKSGKKVYGPLFIIAFDHVKGVSQFLIEQHEIGKIQIKLLVDNHFNNNNGLISIKNKLTTVFLDDLDYEIDFVNELYLSRSGKRRTVISYLNN